MRKFSVLILFFLISALSAFSADMRFIQISDIRYCDENSDQYKDLIEQINREKNVEFVVFTGDNINRPDKKLLESFLNETKKLKSPFYIVLGDHDVNKHKDLGKEEYFKIISKQLRKFKQTNPNYIFEKNGLVFILLDGSKEVIPSTTGYYKDEVLDWLEEQLNNTKDKNVIIFQHFPIIPPSTKETYYTFKPEKYLKILKNHSNVKSVISGHFGINKEITQDGIIHISTSQAPQYRVIDVLDYDTKLPVIWAQIKNTD